MGTPGRKPSHSVAAELKEEPYRFSFFQAVRLLERMYPDRSPVGGDNHPRKEVVRFRSLPSLAFPASEIHDLKTAEPNENGERPENDLPEMMVTFMGLAGPLGVLPASYTEELIARARARDFAMAEFFDLFNHRFLSLFYRAWEKYRFAVAFERGTEDQFTEGLLHMVGLGTPGLRNRMAFPDKAVVFYGGLTMQTPRSACSVQIVLSHYLGVPVEVEQFVGRWINLEEDDVTELGKNACTLGDDMVAGSRVWDQQSKFRLKIGALTFEQFQSFLPDGSQWKVVMDFVRLLVGIEYEFDVQLILKAPEVPDFVLGSGENQPRLSWTTWLKTEKFQEDDTQVILEDSE